MENSELTKVILDINGFPVPQYYSEENELYAVETTDGSLILSIDVNFALIPMLLDYNGFPIPQLWDPTLEAFVPRTTQSGGGSGGGGDYTLPTATTTRLGGIKPDGVTVETDADGVLSIKDGAVAPIQSLVRSVNFFLPDPDTGDVALPPIPPPEYRYVDVLSPLEPESEYEMGTTAFITYFERSTMPEWAAIFDNPNVPDGDMMVVTHKYNNGVMHCIQMVDTFRDGEFKAQFSRQWDYTEGEWTPLNDISYVQSVNGIKPNVSGDITIPEATTTVKGIVQLASGHNASQNPRIPTVQVMNTAINQHANQKATTGVTGHVRVDGTTITVDANGIISATVGGNPVNLSDDYMLGDSDVAASTKATDELYSDMNANFVQLLEDFLEHQDTKGSSTEYGHIRVDGTTIISSNGVISATGGGSGTPGPQGPPGEDGKDGTKWYAGPYEPAPGEGESGDYWLNTDTGDIYYYAGGVWNLSTGNLKGPQGDPGSILDDSVLPTTPPQDFQKGFTITSPHGNSGNSVYVAWRDWIIESTGANIDYTLPFLIYIETTKSDYPKTSQTIRVIVPSFGGVGYNEVMRLYRFSLTTTGAFNPPGVEMTTIRGSGNPEGSVYGLIGNSYYDYTNKLMYVKTEEGPVDPQANGWVVESSGGSGTPGPKGDKGDPGEQGIQGLPGAEGAVGPKGDKGDKGETGSQGNPGTNGLDGAKGDKGDTGATGPKGDKGDKGDTGATGPQGIPGEDGDPLQIANNLTTTEVGKALDATQGKKLSDDLSAHTEKVASTTELGHVKIDGTSVKMHENNQLYVDVGDLPIPIQINNEYILSDSPTTYPVGHTITMLGPGDTGFADLISEFNLDYDIELTTLNTRFIVQTVKNKNSMTHQTAQAITNNRGSVLGTMYRFSQSTYYGFSSWYSQTHVLTGRGAPGDQGRGEGISGNLYVNSITGKVHAKAGYDKTVGYTNWRLVGPAVVNNTFDPVEDDDEHVYSAYTVEQMFEGAKNNLKNNVKMNRIWDSRPITASATTWTVDFSDEEELTDLNNYWFEVYDDGVLVFGNPITHTVNNDNKTVTFTPQTPMSRPFTITCIGRGMEFPQ